MRQRTVVLSELLERAKTSHVSPYAIAVVYAALDQKDEAFRWMERGFYERPSDLPNIKIDPRFDGLRSDPRYQVLLRRMGLPL